MMALKALLGFVSMLSICLGGGGGLRPRRAEIDASEDNVQGACEEESVERDVEAFVDVGEVAGEGEAAVSFRH